LKKEAFIKKGKTHSFKYLKETKAQFDSIDSSRDIYTSIRDANRTLRKLKALKQGYSWNEAPTGWLWVKLRLSELLDDIGFELLLMLRKIMFGLAVLVGWMLVLSLVIVWLGGIK
jgi:hypothetical protein